MAEAKKSSSGGKGLKKKLGPLPYWGWAAVGAGTFLVYRYLRARSAAGAANAASGITGGNLPPNVIGNTANPSPTTGPSFATTAAWTEAAITFLTAGGMNPADALNSITSWLNGNCVTKAAYNGLGAAINNSSIGLPPGYSSVPPLTICSTPSATSGGGTSTPPPSVTLPTLNAQSFPLKVLFGQYSPSDYTKIGTVNNGVYQGASVGGGAPVYANVFGGFVQDFNFATLPNGTDIYVPTNLLDYVSGHTPAGATVPAAA